jgi:hypothetical protein
VPYEHCAICQRLPDFLLQNFSCIFINFPFSNPIRFTKEDGMLIPSLHVTKLTAVNVAVKASGDACIRNANGVSYSTYM